MPDDYNTALIICNLFIIASWLTEDIPVKIILWLFAIFWIFMMLFSIKSDSIKRQLEFRIKLKELEYQDENYKAIQLQLENIEKDLFDIKQKGGQHGRKSKFK